MKVKNRLLDYDAIIYQEDEWFKFSLDSVLLANFVTLNLRTKKIIDLATGNAPIPILLSYRTKASIYGIELQRCVYDLGLDSILKNHLDKQIQLLCGDIKEINLFFESDSFDVVTCNPPYFPTKHKDYLNGNMIKAIARHEIKINLHDILKSANYLLKSGGVFAMVHRTERMVEILDMMRKCHLEPKRIQFIYPKPSKNSDLFLIEGIKNGNVGLKMLPPLIIHEDNGDYTKEVSQLFSNH